MWTKASALREAARRISSAPENYSHFMFGNCNCGIVAQVVGRKSADDACLEIGAFEFIDWSQVVRAPEWTCSTTGLPMGHVIRLLRETGFTSHEMCDLEYLTNEIVLLAMGEIPGRELRPDIEENVVRYLNVWSDLLDAESPELTQATAKAKDVAYVPSEIVREPLLLG